MAKTRRPDSGKNQTRGARAEAIARRYLERTGLSLESANFNCRFGEIDLIMRDGNTRVFIEVRSRRSSRHMHPRDSIDAHKQRRIARAAEAYLQLIEGRFNGPELPCRFDVVCVLFLPSGADVEWLKDAFTL